jgi:phosphoadenosine phosphosulfate reductase
MMIELDALQDATDGMAAPALLRHLLVKACPGGCAVTSSLRARSVATLHMIAEIDRATPVIFCHASYLYPESIDYRARIVRRLGLTELRDPLPDDAAPAPGDQDHFEDVLTDLAGGGVLATQVHLNRSLAGIECWISAGYHRPYSDTAAPRLVREGRLLRVDPLAGWSQQDVHAYLAERDLPLHPRIAVPTYHY